MCSTGQTHPGRREANPSGGTEILGAASADYRDVAGPASSCCTDSAVRIFPVNRLVSRDIRAEAAAEPQWSIFPLLSEARRRRAFAFPAQPKAAARLESVAAVEAAQALSGKATAEA